MREAILEAVRSGRPGDLSTAIELNEIKPVIGDGGPGDPLEAIRRLSPDNQGHDLLAAVGRVLESSWVAVAAGPDIENNRVYVWPKFTQTGIASLSRDEEAEFALLVPAEERAEMVKSGVYTYWRIGIGADGTWHYLRR